MAVKAGGLSSRILAQYKPYNNLHLWYVMHYEMDTAYEIMELIPSLKDA